MSRWIESPSLDLDWGRPPRERYAAIAPEVVDKGRVLLRALMAEVPDGARFLADLIRLRTGGRFHDEAVAIARVLGGDWRTITIANAAYDLALAFYSCSTVALATPSGPVLARNMDWWPAGPLAKTSYLIRAFRGGDLVFANAGWPGAIGVVSGLSGRGFGVVLNAVQAPEGTDKLGYPVLYHIRRVIEEAGDFDQAVRWLCSERLFAGCLLTVVGRENGERVVVERTPRGHAIRRADGDRPILVTNHYRQLLVDGADGVPGLDETTCARFENLSASFADHDGGTEVEDERLLDALTDPGVMQEITAQHVIMRPRAGVIRLFVPGSLV